MQSNLMESFNSWVRIEHHHNIYVFFIEHIDKVGTLLADHESQLQKWNGCFSPRAQEKIDTNILKGETYITHAILARLIKVSIGFVYHEVDL